MKASSSATAVFAVALLLQTGCSTIVHVNRPSGLSVKGNPSGASILVDGVHRGYTAATPVQIAVEGDSGAHVVRVEKKGYLPREFTVEKSMSNWVWGNAPLAVFPVVAAAGVGIDATCGSWYTLFPGEIDVALVSDSPPATEGTRKSPSPDDLFSILDAMGKQSPPPSARTAEQPVVPGAPGNGDQPLSTSADTLELEKLLQLDSGDLDSPPVPEVDLSHP